MNMVVKKISLFFPKPKSRINLIEIKVKDVTKDLLISGFSSLEIAIIAKTINSDIKSALEDRKQILTQELQNTVEAINKL